MTHDALFSKGWGERPSLTPCPDKDGHIGGIPGAESLGSFPGTWIGTLG
jgi:hypothetical protein